MFFLAIDSIRILYLINKKNWVLFNMLLKNSHKSLNQCGQQRYMFGHSHWLCQSWLQVTQCGCWDTKGKSDNVVTWWYYFNVDILNFVFTWWGQVVTVSLYVKKINNVVWILVMFYVIYFKILWNAYSNTGDHYTSKIGVENVDYICVHQYQSRKWLYPWLKVKYFVHF